jgi:hypothetical protein
MPAIDDLIYYNNENECLDFKRKGYKKPKKLLLKGRYIGVENRQTSLKINS